MGRQPVQLSAVSWVNVANAAGSSWPLSKHALWKKTVRALSFVIIDRDLKTKERDPGARLSPVSSSTTTDASLGRLANADHSASDWLVVAVSKSTAFN